MSIQPRLATAAIVATAALLYWPCIDQVPFYTKGEPREAIVVQQMLATGDPVLPLLARGEIQSKPPLFHWLGVLSSLAPGRASETAVRVPSLLASLIVIGATVRAGSLLGTSVGGLAAAVILTTTPLWIQASVTARVDMVLAATIAMALFEFLSAYGGARILSLRAYGWMAAAFLAKGPIGIILPLGVVGCFLVVRRDLDAVRRLRLRAGLLVLCLPLLWYLSAWLAAGNPFLEKLLVEENLLRVIDPAAADSGHAKPAYFYLFALAGGLAPWSALLPAAIRQAFQLPRDRSGRTFLLVWLGMTLAIFSLSGSKRAVYLLPAYPACALLVGAWLTRWLEPGQPGQPLLLGQRTRLSLTATALAFGLATTIAALVLWVPVLHSAAGSLLNPKDAANLAMLAGFARERAPRMAVWLVAVWSSLFLFGHALRAGRWRLAFATPALLVGLTVATVGAPGLFYLAERVTLEPFVARVREEVPPDESLFFSARVQYLEHVRPAVVYYAERAIPVVDSLPVPETGERVWLIAGPDSLAGDLTQSSDADGVGAQAWRTIASSGFGSGRGSLVLLATVGRARHDDSQRTDGRETAPRRSTRRAQRREAR